MSERYWWFVLVAITLFGCKSRPSGENAKAEVRVDSAHAGNFGLHHEKYNVQSKLLMSIINEPNLNSGYYFFSKIDQKKNLLILSSNRTSSSLYTFDSLGVKINEKSIPVSMIERAMFVGTDKIQFWKSGSKYLHIYSLQNNSLDSVQFTQPELWYTFLNPKWREYFKYPPQTNFTDKGGPYDCLKIGFSKLYNFYEEVSDSIIFQVCDESIKAIDPRNNQVIPENSFFQVDIYLCSTQVMGYSAKKNELAYSNSNGDIILVNFNKGSWGGFETFNFLKEKYITSFFDGKNKVIGLSIGDTPGKIKVTEFILDGW